nr:hypothetical protein [Tanacetum cinerariifolium]
MAPTVKAIYRPRVWGFARVMMVEGSGRRGLIEMDEGVAGKGVQLLGGKTRIGEQWFKTRGDRGDRDKGLGFWHS